MVRQAHHQDLTPETPAIEKRIKEDLFDEIETLYRIDWVDLNRVSSEFRREALKKTKVLYG